MEMGLVHGVQRPLLCVYVCACQLMALTMLGSLVSWFPSVLLTPVFVCWFSCDLGMSRPVWGCLATLQAQVCVRADSDLV